MATAATFRRQSGTDERNVGNLGRPSAYHDHDTEPPDLVQASSCSSASSRSSRRRELRRHLEEMERHARDAGHGRGGGRPDTAPHHRSSARGGSDEDMILRGADIVRSQLHADDVHRGAGVVREHIVSPRGVSSPFGPDDDGGGAEAAVDKGGHHRRVSRDLHEESKRALDEIEDLSDRLARSTKFDGQGTQPVDNTGAKKASSDSSMTSSQYHYYFDPFADDEVEVEENGVPLRVPSPPSPDREGSPTTFMAGRDNSIKFKVDGDQTQREYEPDLYGEDAKRRLSYGRSRHHPESLSHEHGRSREQVSGSFSHYDKQQMLRYSASVPGRARSNYPQETRQSRPSSRPRSSKERAYDHAMKAGLLWQTLVGEHVRFPKEWWGGARTPTMGDVPPSGSPSKWQYISRHRVRGNELLNGWVRNRTSAGRLLLHVVVTDSVLGPVQDIAVGCFHPNARGVRRTLKPIMDDESVREIWMAVRKREKAPRRGAQRGGRHDGLSASLLNTALTLGHGIDEVGQPSPLGERHTVTNDNMRAVFGDKPPIATLVVASQELYKIIIDAVEEGRYRGQASPYPARTILQEYLFTRRLR